MSVQSANEDTVLFHQPEPRCRLTCRGDDALEPMCLLEVRYLLRSDMRGRSRALVIKINSITRKILLYILFEI